MVIDFSRYETIIDLIKDLKARAIPEIEYPNMVNQYLETKARMRRTPLIGTFELTPLCNLNCKMCYVHLEPTQIRKSDLLVPKQWKNIMDQAYKQGMRSATLTGGECLTYPGFDELYLHLYSLGVQINILSNGLLMNHARVSFFEKYPPHSIQVSLYGSNNDEYEAVTGNRVFDIVYKNLQLLKESSLPVKIAVTPNQSMNKNINLLLDKIEELKLPYTIAISLLEARENTGRKIEKLSTEDYLKLHRIVKSRQSVPLNTLEPQELPNTSKSGEPLYGLRCGGGRSSFAIRYDGRMCTCVSFADYSVDVLQRGFSTAWKDIVAYADSFPFPQECGECEYSRICFLCPAVHKNAPVGHCDPVVCERTYRFTMEGIFKLP